MSVSIILNLDALGMMDTWVLAAACAGESIKICSDVHWWNTVRNLKVVPTVAQARVLSCYVLQQARPTGMHKPLTQHYLIDDPYTQINKILKTIAFFIQKQASTINQLETIPLQNSSKEENSRVLGREKQLQNSFEIRPEALKFSHFVVFFASLLPALMQRIEQFCD